MGGTHQIRVLARKDEVDDGRDERSELPVYYNCRKERNRFFAALRMTVGVKNSSKRLKGSVILKEAGRPRPSPL